MEAPSVYNALTEEQIKQIKEEINEDEKRFNHSVELLQKWMDCHPFIPKNYDAQMLPTMFRWCKLDMEKTKKKLELYFVSKTICPQHLKHYTFKNSESKHYDAFCFAPSAQLTPDGHKIVFLSCETSDPDLFDIELFSKFLWISCIYILNKGGIEAGYILVIDLSNFSPAWLKILSPKLKQSLKIIEATFPVHVKYIFYINSPSYAEHFLNIVKMFLSGKLKQIVIVESGQEQMEKIIPQYCIPKEFGGSGHCLKDRMTEWMKALNYYQPWFKEHENVKVDIDKIPKELYKTVGIDEEMGTQGSFRQLKID